MSEFGLGEIAQSIVRFSLTRLPRRYTSWRAGAQLLAQATTFQLTGNRRLLEQSTPTLTWASALQAHQITTGRAAGRLLPEALSRHQSAPVDSVTAQLVAWQGLRAMQRTWLVTGASAARSAGRASRGPPRDCAPAGGAAGDRAPRGRVALPPVSLTNGSRPYGQLSASR